MNGEGLTLGSQEDLRKVAWLLIRNGPLVVSWFEHCLTISWLNWVSVIVLWHIYRGLLLIKLFVLEVFLINEFVLKVELKTDDSLNITDILFDVEKLIHALDLKFVLVIAQLRVVAESLEDHILLVGSLGRDSVLEELHDHALIEVHRRVLGLVELVSDLSGQNDLLLSLGGVQLGSPLGLSLDVLLDDLVDRDVQHVVLNGQVGAGSVDTQSLLVVDKDHLRLELIDQLLLCGLQGESGVEIHEVNSPNEVLVRIFHHLLEGLIFFKVLLQGSLLFLAAIGILIQFAPSCLDLLLIILFSFASSQAEHKAWDTELLQEMSVLDSIFMDNSIEDELSFGFLDELADSRFSLFNRDVSFVFSFLGCHGLSDLVSDSLHVNNGAVKVFNHHFSEG